MNRRIILMGRKKNYFKYQVTVTAGQATTPKFTFGAGAPAAFVDWGDGTAQSAVTSGVELNHTYTAGGVYTVTLIAPKQEVYLTQIDINTDKLSQVLTPIQKFPKLTYFRVYTNAAWAQNISGWRLPGPLTFFSVNDTSVSGDISGLALPTLLTYFNVRFTSVSGNISGWILPAALIEFYVDNTFVSGDISGFVLPAPMTYFYVYYNSVSNCPDLDSMVSIRSILVQNTALIQASVDLYLSRCVANEGDTTYATPALNLGGTNQAPSAAGYTDKATLVGLLWVVTTN